MQELNKVFKAAANEKRLLILKNLIHKDRLTLNEIAELINLSFKSTSKHLLLLESRGFVQRHTQGARVIYSISHFKEDDPRIQILKIIKGYK